MRKFRENRDVIILFLLIVLTALSSINIAKTNQMQNKLKELNDADKIVITEEIKTDDISRNTDTHPHIWKELSSNEPRNKVVITCDGCGAIRYIDYVNNKIQESD